MSVLFPKVPEPRKWDYRPIYYDKEKEERREKREQRKLHRGSFREEHEKLKSQRTALNKRSRLVFWIALLLILLGFVYILS